MAVSLLLTWVVVGGICHSCPVDRTLVLVSLVPYSNYGSGSPFHIIDEESKIQ